VKLARLFNDEVTIRQNFELKIKCTRFLIIGPYVFAIACIVPGLGLAVGDLYGLGELDKLLQLGL
jgi:hypothetical protein